MAAGIQFAGYSSGLAYLWAAAAYVAMSTAAAEARGFLAGRHGPVDASLFQEELQGAVGSVMGCGAAVPQERLEEVEELLRPMWQAALKNQHGRVDNQVLREMARRYFMQRSSLVLRGFEASRPASSSNWGAADLLSGRMPSYVEATLQKRHRSEVGFTLEDVAAAVLMLDQLISDSEVALLHDVHTSMGHAGHAGMPRRELESLLEEYMVHWMMGEESEGIHYLLSNRTLLETSFPHWRELSGFVRGQIKALDYARHRGAKPSLGAASYSFEDALEVVGGVTRSFESFWEQECTSLKVGLVEMDSKGTGRVPLGKFYSAALNSEWRYGESEAYLREASALDEKSAWLGKQVIITNYIQAPSNCVITTPHYSVCCMDECELIKSEIEVAVAGPFAAPAALLSIVGNISRASSVDGDDDGPPARGALQRQLQSIANAHSGQVPLQSRQFSQWLHYAFPHQCALPPRRGAAAARSVAEFGDGLVATHAEMLVHAQNVTAPEANLSWPSKDGEAGAVGGEELLILDEDEDLKSPWETPDRGLAAAGAAAAFIFLGILGIAHANPKVSFSTAAVGFKAASGHIV